MESTSPDAALIPAIYRITSPYNHTKQFTCGEHLLRCGINTSNIYNHMIITTLQYKQSLPNNRASAQPHNRAIRAGPREPPEYASGNPLHDSNSLPCYIAKRHYFSITQKWRVSPITRKGLTLLPGLARRPQNLPLGRQPRSPERSLHNPLSI